MCCHYISSLHHPDLNTGRMKAHYLHYTPVYSTQCSGSSWQLLWLPIFLELPSTSAYLTQNTFKMNWSVDENVDSWTTHVVKTDGTGTYFTLLMCYKIQRNHGKQCNLTWRPAKCSESPKTGSRSMGTSKQQHNVSMQPPQATTSTTTTTDPGNTLL